MTGPPRLFLNRCNRKERNLILRMWAKGYLSSVDLEVFNKNETKAFICKLLGGHMAEIRWSSLQEIQELDRRYGEPYYNSILFYCASYSEFEADRKMQVNILNGPLEDPYTFSCCYS